MLRPQAEFGLVREEPAWAEMNGQGLSQQKQELGLPLKPPVAGFSEKLVIEFRSSMQPLPTSETCMHTLKIPVAHADITSFRSKMDLALKECSSAVFGSV